MILAHIAGVPVEETLPGVLAVGFLGVRLSAHYLQQRARRLRSRRLPAAER